MANENRMTVVWAARWKKAAAGWLEGGKERTGRVDKQAPGLGDGGQLGGQVVAAVAAVDDVLRCERERCQVDAKNQVGPLRRELTAAADGALALGVGVVRVAVEEVLRRVSHPHEAAPATAGPPIWMFLPQWLLYAPPVRPVKPRNVGVGGA
jgi:hypothetical protein